MAKSIEIIAITFVYRARLNILILLMQVTRQIIQPEIPIFKHLKLFSKRYLIILWKNQQSISVMDSSTIYNCIAIALIFRQRLRLAKLVIKIQRRIWRIYELRKIYLLINKLAWPKARCTQFKVMKYRFMIILWKSQQSQLKI